MASYVGIDLHRQRSVIAVLDEDGHRRSWCRIDNTSAALAAELTAAGPDAEGAMEAFQQLIRARPGSTRVVIHVPTGRTGSELPMELRTGVAYDAELLAEVGRRLGTGAVELRLA